MSRPPAARAKSTDRSRWAGLLLTGLLLVMAAFPGAAQAHGAVSPIASSYLATVTQAPAGLDAKVVDGDLRLWLRAAPSKVVVVLDYRGGPYLRFSPSGVAVNVNSVIYDLNLIPAEPPPSNLSPAVAPRWLHVSSGHEYGWHDGRLHALASTALSPGTTYIGRWSIPVVIDRQRRSIAGSLLHAASPSIVWFWPIVVLLACLIATWRLRRPALDARLARLLAIAGLIAVAVAAGGRELHGRPAVSIGQLILLAFILAFVGWGMHRVLVGAFGWISCLMVSAATLWAGLVLVPTLLRATC